MDSSRARRNRQRASGGAADAAGRPAGPDRRRRGVGHGGPARIAPNRLNRVFTPAAPNQVWVGDITYVRTREGFLYLAVVLDLFSRRVVGWSMQPTLSRDLVMHALLPPCGDGSRRGRSSSTASCSTTPNGGTATSAACHRSSSKPTMQRARRVSSKPWEVHNSMPANACTSYGLYSEAPDDQQLRGGLV